MGGREGRNVHLCLGRRNGAVHRGGAAAGARRGGVGEARRGTVVGFGTDRRRRRRRRRRGCPGCGSAPAWAGCGSGVVAILEETRPFSAIGGPVGMAAASGCDHRGLEHPSIRRAGETRSAAGCGCRHGPLRRMLYRSHRTYTYTCNCCATTLS